MAIIPVDVSAAEEPKPVPKGVYPLQVIVADYMTSKSGKPMFKVSIAIEGHPDAPNVNHFITLPAEGDEPGKAKFKALMLKRFLTVFGIPVPNQIDTDKLPMQMVGAKGKCELDLDENDGAVYNRLELPKLSSEKGAAGSFAPPPAQKR